MIRIIRDYEKDFDNTPNSGWKDGLFYLVSAGKKIKRVYSPTCDNIPDFAWSKPGAPGKEQGEFFAKQKAATISATVEKQRRIVEQKQLALQISHGHDFDGSGISEYYCRKCQIVKEWHA